MNIVRDILKNTYDEHLDDGVFWVASQIKQSGCVLDIYIEDQYVVGFSEHCRDDLIQPIDSFRRKRDANTLSLGIPKVLVSSGSILLVNGEMLVKQRTLDAKHDPGAWTTPAGRCDHTVYETALKETVEEINITDARTGERIYPDVCKEFYGNELSYFKTKLGVQEYFDLPLYTVNAYFRKELVESRRMWFWFDSENNTLEVRLVLTGFIETKVFFSNPEYNTEAKLADPAWLAEQPLVPVLQQVIQFRRLR